MQINFKYNTKCPVCGDKLVVIDNYNSNHINSALCKKSDVKTY